jgi:pSer/pThr/pTyr-binding forkhead associated (FHA) protein
VDVGVTTIGRARESTLWLQSEKVSREHAEIHISGEVMEIIDLGSTNGTYLNEQRLQPNQRHYLKPGDEIRFGDQVFTLQLG